MVVQHNLQAMNANRMLNITTGAQSKSTEKLSSGYKINRAADDAAGLSISEKMRKQIKGLDQASSNAQDGVSAVQTAEGALTEVHSMLQRMNELAVQASNGTNSESDRQSIQDEISQLTTEIDRVAETTKFNETYLLKGNVAGTSSDVKVAAHDAGLAGKLVDNGDGTADFKLNDALKVGDKVTIAGQEYTIGDDDGAAETERTTADFVDKTTAAALTHTDFKVGDSITTSNGTLNISNNATVSELTTAGNTNLKAGDKFTDADGIEWTISTAATDKAMHSADHKTGTVGLNNIADALKAGSTVTILNGAALAAEKQITVVDAHAADDIYLDATALDTKLGALTQGDTITQSGVTKTVYDENVSTDGTKSLKDIEKEIGDLATDGTAAVKIGSNSYTVAKETDAANNLFSKDDIMAMIKDGCNVEFGGKKYYVFNSEKKTDSAEDAITIKDAYAKMADELAKASSIGTDEGKEATVVNNGDGTFRITQGSVEVKDGLSFSLHVGADADMTNKINVDIESMSAAGLGIKGLNVTDDSGIAATYAIDAIADAVAKVSAQRSALGAVQNRLEHTIDNVDNVVENTTAAESRIRDTDMAEEMVNYSKNNILAQAGQSMLAQANQANQGVLSLLG